MSSSHRNRVRLNTFYGNGSATSKSSPSDPNSNNFGLGLIGTSSNNLVEKNKIGGNINGVYLGRGGNVIGNTIRRNIIAGNPPVQVSKDFGASIGADIQNLSTPGANTFEDNRCLTYAGAGPSPCLNVGKPQNDEDAEKEDVATFSRKRLVFPHARLVDAVFHPSDRPLP